jgi:hypothetical protein
VDAGVRGGVAPSLLGGEQLGGSPGGGGLSGATLLLAEHSEGHAQPS